MIKIKARDKSSDKFKMEQGNMKEVRLPLTTREYGLLEGHAKRAGYSSLPDYLKCGTACCVNSQHNSS